MEVTAAGLCSFTPGLTQTARRCHTQVSLELGFQSLQADLGCGSDGQRRVMELAVPDPAYNSAEKPSARFEPFFYFVRSDNDALFLLTCADLRSSQCVRTYIIFLLRAYYCKLESEGAATAKLIETIILLKGFRHIAQQ